IKDVVISAFGLREGLLYARLPPEERSRDPLVEFARAANARNARVPAHAQEMLDWTRLLFEGETAQETRIREASAFFSDVAWRRHPDDRAVGAFNQVVTAPFAGATHRERALIATAIFHRYSGDEDFPRDVRAHDLLGEEDEMLARRIGLAARLAFSLSASAERELPHYPLRVTPTRLLLDVSSRRQRIAGDPVQKRLGTLAALMDRKGEILIG
ncbi:MAG: Ppx/GppA family phosphatase, partial [Rhizomicrobium sp.]